MPKWIFQKTSTDQQGERLLRIVYVTFFKLVYETKISKPLEPTINKIKLWILLPLRADLRVTLQYGIPCTCTIICKQGPAIL